MQLHHSSTPLSFSVASSNFTSRIKSSLKSLYYLVKHQFYTLRYSNLSIAPGAYIRGKVHLEPEAELIIHSGVFIQGSVKLERGAKVTLHPNVSVTGDLHVSGCPTVEIGADCLIRLPVSIYGTGSLTVGRQTFLNGTQINCLQSITIGDECLVSDCFIVDTDYHNIEPDLRHEKPGPKATAPIVIEKNVWIGARATVMKGVRVGMNSVVGLGTIVRRAVPPNVVVIGNPQQIVKHFTVDSSNANCPETQQHQTSINAGVPG